MSEQKLKKVDGALRKQIQLTTSTNRRMAQDYQREQERRRGRGVCSWCGAESCGHLWTRPRDTTPGGERCCDRCSHEPVEGWQHTHTAWDGLVKYPVCAVTMREGDVVYLRRDGIAQFIEMRAPAPGSALGGAELMDVPTVAFLGRDGGVALYVVTEDGPEGGPEHVNLWEKKRELDVVWLPIRVQSAVAHDQRRRDLLAAELQAAAEEYERKENERREREKAELATSIEKRQLKHETVTVLRELGGSEPDEDDIEMPEDGGDGSEEVPAQVTEPMAKLSRSELKKPAPVKAGPGRPKRSKRQRDARARQKRAWAVQEARQRLEVKRLERLGRSSDPTHDKEDE